FSLIRTLFLTIRHSTFWGKNCKNIPCPTDLENLDLKPREWVRSRYRSILNPSTPRRPHIAATVDIPPTTIAFPNSDHCDPGSARTPTAPPPQPCPPTPRPAAAAAIAD